MHVVRGVVGANAAKGMGVTVQMDVDIASSIFKIL